MKKDVDDIKDEVLSELERAEWEAGESPFVRMYDDDDKYFYRGHYVKRFLVDGREEWGHVNAQGARTSFYWTLEQLKKAIDELEAAAKALERRRRETVNYSPCSYEWDSKQGQHAQNCGAAVTWDGDGQNGQCQKCGTSFFRRVS